MFVFFKFIFIAYLKKSEKLSWFEQYYHYFIQNLIIANNLPNKRLRNIPKLSRLQERSARHHHIGCHPIRLIKT